MLMCPNNNLENTVKPAHRHKLNLYLFKATLTYTAMAGNFKYRNPNNDKYTFQEVRNAESSHEHLL